MRRREAYLEKIRDNPPEKGGGGGAWSGSGRAEPGHRYIKPCFLVLGLDFFHFNSCGDFFALGQLKYIYNEF